MEFHTSSLVMASEEKRSNPLFRVGRIIKALWQMRWNIPVEVGYFFIFVGLVHFIVIGADSTALIHIQPYHIEIIGSPSLDNTQLIPLNLIILTIDALCMAWGFIVAFKAEIEGNKFH